MRLDKMRMPIIRQEPGIGDRAPDLWSAARFDHHEQSVGCFDNQRAEFGARPYALEDRGDPRQEYRGRQARDELA